MTGDKKSRFTTQELTAPKTSIKRAFSGLFIAVADTRDTVSAEVQEHITTLAVDCLQNPEEERKRMMLDIAHKANLDTQNWQETDAETLVVDSLDGKNFAEDIQEQIIADPVAFIEQQISIIKETKRKDLAEVEGKDAANIAVAKIQQIIDQAGVSSNPVLLQKLKQEIEKRARVTLPDMQGKNATKPVKGVSVTNRGKM